MLAGFDADHGSLYQRSDLDLLLSSPIRSGASSSRMSAMRSMLGFSI
jgi:hypothetical protein